MPDHHETPFAGYLRRIDARLRDLPPERRQAIRRELLAHLEDAAAEHGGDPTDPLVQRAVIAALGPERLVGAQFGAVYRGPAWLLRRAARACGLLGGGLGMVAAPFAGLPAPGDPLRLAAMLLLLAAGGLGIAGVVRLGREQPGGAWRTALAAALLLGGGLRLFYQGSSSLDPLGGLELLIAGELLLVALAGSAPSFALPQSTRHLLLAAALLLISFVAPFSALPNPLGAYYLLAGGYRYDPRQPLFNRFATLRDGDPIPLVAARLDQLLGQVGLAPLDPGQPLVGYSVRGVRGATRFSWAAVAVVLRFADGSQREVEIPALHAPWGHLTGVDGIATPHRALPGLPAADARAPFRLGDPARLAVAPAGERLLANWYSPNDAGAARWSPDRRALLVRAGDGSPAVIDPSTGLWLVPLDGGAPTQLADSASDAVWNADGRTIVLVQERGPAPGPVWRRTISAYNTATGASRVLGATDRSQLAVVGAQVFFLNGGALWRAPLASGAPERIAMLPDAGAITADGALAVSPDGERVAYRCWSDLCLAGMDGRLLARLRLGFQPPQALEDSQPAPEADPNAPYAWSFELAWSPDGQRLALATAATDERGTPELRLLTREGRVVALVGLGPDGAVGAPQWRPDGSALLLMTYPRGGRRIVAVDTNTRAVSDLSRPHWDALASLSPDGARLLLWNGRGGFWAAPVSGAQ